MASAQHEIGPRSCREVVVDAPCKLLVAGEHAVVYGTQALAIALDRHTRVKATRIPAGESSIVLDCLGAHQHHIPQQALDALVRHIRSECELENDVFLYNENVLPSILSCCSSTSLDSAEANSEAIFAFLLAAIVADASSSVCVRVSGGVPVGAGLGSSAAYSVGLCLSLLRLAGKKHDHHTLNRWAFEAERITHGTPSGVDNTIVTYGGAISYRKGCEPVHIEPKASVRVLLVNTGVPRSTKALVARVRRFSERLPQVSARIFDAIESIVVAAQQTLQQEPEDPQLLPELVELNQHLLRSIGVSHPSIEKVINICSSHGVSAKLTGAGGGGCVAAFLPLDIDEPSLASLKLELRSASFDCFEARLSHCGATVVQCLPTTDP